MAGGPRNYSILTLKRLFALSGNKCAFPDCPIVFTNPLNTLNYSNICHIEDAEIGGRYNPKMTDEQRASFDLTYLNNSIRRKEYQLIYSHSH